jgi:putative transposase
MKADANGGRSSATPSNVGYCPERKKPAHFATVEVGFRSIIIFLTVCTHRRRTPLANDQAARLIITAWRAANFWRIGRYVITPDHIHFCAPNTFPPQPLKNWVSFWRNHVPRAWPHRDQTPIRQRDYWDRQLRRHESYAQKWEYVVNNPVRHGCVVHADDWRFQGELNVLSWHD